MLVLAPFPPALRVRLVGLWRTLRFGWAERATRELLTQQRMYGGDLKLGLALGRSAVEHASERGGYPLILALTSYGGLLLTGGWLAEGERFLAIAEEMTRGWQRHPVRRALVLGLIRCTVSRSSVEPAGPLLAEMDAMAESGNSMNRARWLETRALLLRNQGKPGEAAVIYREALLAARRTGRKDFRAVMANNYAGALIDAGDPAGAEPVLREAEALAGRGSVYRAFFWGTRADLALARGDLAAAKAAIDRSWQLKEAGGATGGIAWTRATQARLAAANGDLATARSLLAEAAPGLQDLVALRAWEAAAAVALPGSRAALGEAAPDPLAEHARAAARPLARAIGELEQSLQWVLAVALGLALLWLIRDVALSPVGYLVVDVVAGVSVLVIGYRYLRDRMPSR